MMYLVAALFLSVASTPMARLATKPLPTRHLDVVGCNPLRLRLMVYGREGAFGLYVGNEGKPYDDGEGMNLRGELARVKLAHPDSVDIELHVADDAPYERLVRAMDVAVGAGFPVISFASNEPQ